jgi:hypothetical protein
VKYGGGTVMGLVVVDALTTSAGPGTTCENLVNGSSAAPLVLYIDSEKKHTF